MGAEGLKTHKIHDDFTLLFNDNFNMSLPLPPPRFMGAEGFVNTQNRGPDALNKVSICVMKT